MYEAPTRAGVVKVCHVAMGDLWAGAEVQLLALIKYSIRLPGFEWAVILFNEGKLADELRKLPVSLSIISENEHNPVAIAYRLAKKFREVRPDIVHTHKYKDSILASIVARYLRIPHVVRVVHGMPEPFKGLKNLKMTGYTVADRFVSSQLVDKVVAVSADLERILSQVYGADRVACIHNGIDLETVHVTIQRSDKRREWQIDDKEVLIGTVGRLVPVKGHAILLGALRILRNSNHNVKLVLIGDGPLRGHLEAEVKQLGLEPAVIFAGHQEQSYDYINMMDIFVLPSLHEGIPMVLLEALALRKPVVVSRVGGIPEVVSHCTSGILVGPADPEELAVGLRELIEDWNKAKQMGDAGRCRVEQEFDASLMAARTAALYESLSEN